MPESLTNFSPQLEAKFFFHLLESGWISYEKACEDIALSEMQRDWLIQSAVVKPWQGVALFELRQETLRCFKELAHRLVEAA